MTPDEYHEFQAERREAGKRLDPDAATIFDSYVDECDPYGLSEDDEPPMVVGKHLFVTSTETGKIWFYDLPDETRERLMKRMEQSVNPLS